MNAPAHIRIAYSQHEQHRKLEAIIAAANRALPAAAKGDLFESHAGHAFFAALYDLTGCDSATHNCFNLMHDAAHMAGIQLED